jgi:hypothetical protein
MAAGRLAWPPDVILEAVAGRDEYVGQLLSSIFGGKGKKRPTVPDQPMTPKQVRKALPELLRRNAKQPKPKAAKPPP